MYLKAELLTVTPPASTVDYILEIYRSLEFETTIGAAQIGENGCAEKAFFGFNRGGIMKLKGDCE